ncbi:glycosyltransferase family 4 protein [Sphingobacterium griseoflavum]|uniref:Glycosyl transferase n=1 Tax=Sphingobacterium griseoflavum TaxID=1474952 RepID=A0ABQ3HVJ6_9SPHI|nr:glycosyltransferase family 4 protein [Sphingobacterium griseoflavum]GHE38919.1 glycosyl transferase [Sphingobacterium griseoflavum]
MKLLFFISSLRGGGAERVLSTVCNELVDRGHDVFLVTNLRINFAYDIDPRIKTIELFPVPHLKHNVVKRYFSLYRHIRKTVKEIRPDIVTSFMVDLNIHIILANMLSKVPIVASEHYSFDSKHSFFRYVSRFYINRLASKVVLLTNYDYEFLGKRLPNKIVIPNPINYEPVLEDMVRQRTILAAGSINRWFQKGFDNLLRVWSEIYSSYPDWTLKIAGQGSEEKLNYLKNLVSQMGLSESVVFMGFQSDMQSVFQESEVFVLSSRYEGLPMVLIEAMSQGCACISFDCISGPREIIEDRVSGVLIENQNLDEMKNKLIEVMSNSRFRTQLQRNAVIESLRFSKSKVIDKWEMMYNELLGASANSSVDKAK